MKFGIIKERKKPSDRRVVFSPEKLQEFKNLFPKTTFKIESSELRIFPNKSYEEKGFEITENMSDCDVLLGVKEVPIENLIPDKKYFFFSHTLKKQPYNRKLLQTILEKNITLYDHETIANEKGNRLIGFGRYAGIVGVYNGFRAYGLKYNIFDLPKANDLNNQKMLMEKLNSIKIPNIKILLTGSGKVADGVKEILEGMNIKKIAVNDYLEKTFSEPVYCSINILDYNKRKDGQILNNKDFYKNPKEYISDFLRFTKVTDYFIAGHFFSNKNPDFFTHQDTKSPTFKIKVISDISCDIAGPIATTIRPSTIANPIYGYNPETSKEIDFKNKKAIVVTAVDNLPCEIPKDASEGFGESFLKHVIPAFFNDDKDGILTRAKMTENGKLTEKYKYLQNYVDGKE